MNRYLKVENVRKLQGEIKIPGSKNSSLALIAAACLSNGRVTLKGIPNIGDFRVICDILNEIGVTVEVDLTNDKIISIHSDNIKQDNLDPHNTSKYRASYYFVGALLARVGKIRIGYPGGDDFGNRPIDQHIKALTSLGAVFRFYPEFYEVTCNKLIGNEICFDVITSGATINAMMAAVLAEGKTVLYNAARDPEVVDTASLLNMMGAKIRGAGTDVIRIEGVTHLNGCTYTVIPDRLIAGAFLMAAGITGGEISVLNVIPEHLGSCMHKLREIGMEFEIMDDRITAYSTGKLKAVSVKTGMYPEFATDLQQPITPLLIKANGKSIVTDRIYPKRFNHVYELRKMGAEIELIGASAVIKGNIPLNGCLVRASDVRAGTCLILAGLLASEPTYIADIEHIERGYEDVVSCFRALGANLEIVSESDLPFLNNHKQMLNKIINKVE